MLFNADKMHIFLFIYSFIYCLLHQSKKNVLIIHIVIDHIIRALLVIEKSLDI